MEKVATEDTPIREKEIGLPVEDYLKLAVTEVAENGKDSEVRTPPIVPAKYVQGITKD